jgi:hypothetical protein
MIAVKMLNVIITLNHETHSFCHCERNEVKRSNPVFAEIAASSLRSSLQ